MSVLSKIQALITAANNTTGESDTTLTDAVQTLVDGYGQGGSAPARSKWFRPPDMPDYDSLIDKSIFDRDPNGGTRQINAFLTVATNIPELSVFRMKYSTFVSVTYGQIANGEFQMEGTVNKVGGYFELDLSVIAETENYVVIHVVKNDTYLYQLHDALSWSHATAKTALSPVVEVYGLWDGATIVEVIYGVTQFLSAKYVTLFGDSVRTNEESGYMYSPRWVEVIDVSNCVSFSLKRPMSDCFSLKQFILPKSNVTLSTNDTACFQNCLNLESLDLSDADFRAFTTLASWFSGCSSLKTLDLTNVDWSTVTNVSNLFYRCESLSNLILDGATLPGVSLSFADCTELSVISLVAIIAALPTVTSATLTIGTTNKNKLTAEQIAVATGKGWTVA